MCSKSIMLPNLCTLMCILLISINPVISYDDPKGAANQAYLWSKVKPRDPSVDDYGNRGPREISNLLVGAEKIHYSGSGISAFLTAWSILIELDINIPEAPNSTDPFPISVPDGDPAFLPTEIQFNRSQRLTRKEGIEPGYVQTRNTASPVIDCSQIYGEDHGRSLRLGRNGLLRSYSTKTAGEFPEFDTVFIYGSAEVNLYPTVNSIAVLLYREHNRRARAFVAANAWYSDDYVFDYARRMVIATVQKITFQEYLPFLFGEGLPKYSGLLDVNPGIDIFFSTVAFPFARRALNSVIYRIDEAGNVINDGNLFLTDALNSIDDLMNFGIEPVIRGMTTDQMLDVNLRISEALRSQFKGKLARDMQSESIQRCRELGIPKYNEARVGLGLAPIKEWTDLTTESVKIAILSQIYNTTDNLEAFIGAYSEGGGTRDISNIIYTSIFDQFLRIRAGDNSWYELTTTLSDDERADIANVTLATLIADNSEFSEPPSNPFKKVPDGYYSSRKQNTKSSTVAFSKDMELSYVIQNDTILFDVRSNYTGWFSFGFGTSMAQLDLFLFRKQANGTWSIDNGYTMNYGDVYFYTTGVTSNVFDYVDMSATTKHFRFSRLLAPTGQSRFISITDIDQPVAFAGSNSNFPSYHSTRGVVMVNFFLRNGLVSVMTTSSDTFRAQSFIFHGFVMTVNFGVLAPIGIFIARYSPNMKNWVDRHSYVMTIIITNSLITALTAVATNSASSTVTSVHAIIGYVMCFFLVTLWISGHLSSSLNWSNSAKYSVYFRRYHKIMGVIMFVLGTGNCYMVKRTSGNMNVTWLSIIVPTFVTICIIIYVERRRRQKIRSSEEASETIDRSKVESMIPIYSWKEFGSRIDSGHDWLLINGTIYDITHLLKKHPGGRAMVFSMVGLDASRYFGSEKYPIDGVYCHSRLARYMLQKLAVGQIVAVAKDMSMNITSNYETTSQANSIPGSRFATTNRKSKHSFATVNRTLALNGSERGDTQISDTETIPEYIPTSNRFKDYTLISSAIITKANARNKVVHLRFFLPGRYKSPAGSHVLFQYMSSDYEVVTRAYTPIHHINNGKIDFFIKLYEGGAMAGYIEHMTSVQISFSGVDKDSEVFCYQRADLCWSNLGIIVGGSGLAFALSMIEYHLHHGRSRPQGLSEMKICLINSNHSVDDMFGLELLNELVESSEGCLKVKYVVTTPPPVDDTTFEAGTYYEGHVTGEILKEHMPSHQASSDTAIFICGPPKFMKKMAKLLEHDKYPSSMIHLQ